MASKSSIAIRRNGAIAQIIESVKTIWGEEIELPRRHRNPALLATLQLQTVADYLGTKAGLENAPVSHMPDYEDMNFNDLKLLAKSRGILLNRTQKKRDVIALLTESDNRIDHAHQ